MTFAFIWIIGALVSICVGTVLCYRKVKSDLGYHLTVFSIFWPYWLIRLIGDQLIKLRKKNIVRK